MTEYILSFLIGGSITALIVYFENSGLPLVSRLAALFPIFTWISYIFIGRTAGDQAVSRHSLFVLFGTIFAWLPYMFVIYYFSDKIGSGKAIVLGIATFLVLASIFIKFYKLPI